MSRCQEHITLGRTDWTYADKSDAKDTKIDVQCVLTKGHEGKHMSETSTFYPVLKDIHKNILEWDGKGHRLIVLK